jgi:aerobic C4-dicarboxylate transport protein
MNVALLKKLGSTLYVQVLIGIAAGILVGHFAPQIGVDMKPLGDIFIKIDPDVVGADHFCIGRGRHRAHG